MQHQVAAQADDKRHVPVGKFDGGPGSAKLVAAGVVWPVGSDTLGASGRRRGTME